MNVSDQKSAQAATDQPAARSLNSASKNSFEDRGVTGGKRYRYAVAFHELREED